VKEFIEQVKLYKEYVLTIAAIVGGISLLMNYFATNEELMTTKQTLNRLINERECWLSSRITISEVAAAIANLERERLEKTRLKIDLSSQAQTQLSPVNELYKKEQLDQISKDFQRIASDNLFNGTCRILKEVP
jgi:predicted nucleic acid-binding protein